MRNSRSRFDLMRWADELMTRLEFEPPYGFHVIAWSHSDFCPLNPDRGAPPDHWSRCECHPDGTLIVHFGTPEERRVEVVRNGIPLPINTEKHRNESCGHD